MRRLSLVLCLALLSACTSDPDSAPSPGSSSAGSVGALPSPSLGGFTESEDVLDVAIPEPATLDPMRIQDPGSVLVARQLYEGLTAWDQTSETVVPAAAESWDVSDGGRRFTFLLRAGMTFHDGSPVTSKDFAYAFDRIARKENGAELAYALEGIEGFTDVNQEGAKTGLSGIKTPDDLTLVIDLTEPFMEFPAILTHPGLVPLSRTVVEQEDTFIEQPVGNGPFQIVEPWTPGAPVVLRRFDGFVRTPPLDGIRFFSFPDAAASWLGFVNGEFDVAEVPAGQVDAAAQTYGDRGYVPFLATYGFGMNLSSDHLDDRKLREAITKAIDRESIIQRIYKDTMTLPRGIVPSGMPGFLENVCGEVCEHRPDEAERIVDRLSRAQRKIRIDYTAGEPHDLLARTVRADLEAVGLEVSLHGYSFGKYIEILQSGNQQMYRLGWIAEFPTAHVFLDPLFSSDSPDNHSGFASEKVDRLLAQAEAEAAPGRRVQLYVAAEKEIMKTIPIAPIGTFLMHWAAQGSVEGIVFDVLGGFDAVDIKFTE